MVKLENIQFKSWLDLYGKAWMNLDPALIDELFTKDATYHEKPFEEPMKGIDAIRKYWNIVADTQKDVKFEYEILESNNGKGVAHWKSSFVRPKPNTLVLLDGILVVHLDSENKCTRFQEWWQSKKTKNF